MFGGWVFGGWVFSGWVFSECLSGGVFSWTFGKVFGFVIVWLDGWFGWLVRLFDFGEIGIKSRK